MSTFLLSSLFLSACVDASDPTLMLAANPGFAPSVEVPAGDNSAMAGSSLLAGSSEDAPEADAEAETAGNAEDGKTEIAATEPAGGVDALNRGITQNGAARPVVNLYSTQQPDSTSGESEAELGSQPTTLGAQAQALSGESLRAPGVSQMQVSAIPTPQAAPGRQANNSDESAAETDAEADAEEATQTAAAEEESAPSPVRTALAEEPKRKSIFGRLFSASPSPPRDVPQTRSRGQVTVSAEETDDSRVVKTLPNDIRIARASTSGGSGSDSLPGVRLSSLFEIQTGSDEDGENARGVEVASAAGLARLAPNGLHVQTERVDVACLKPRLVRVLKTVERHYGKPVVITSGFRSPSRNRKIGGARNSRHTSCEAADIQVAGVSKWELAKYLRAMPGRGGVGTYCHTRSVHVDIGTQRDWNWRCRRRK